MSLIEEQEKYYWKVDYFLFQIFHHERRISKEIFLTWYFHLIAYDRKVHPATTKLICLKLHGIRTDSIVAGSCHTLTELPDFIIKKNFRAAFFVLC